MNSIKSSVYVFILISLLGCIKGNDSQEHHRWGSTANINAPKEVEQYGRFVGSWACEISNLTREGDWINEMATWNFVYILDGFAIQDFWFKKNTPASGQNRDYLGSNLRIFNPDSKKWKCAWVQNGSLDMNAIWTSYRTASDEMIIHDDSMNWQITFYNITKETFDWKWDFKLEDGSMQTRVKLKAKRIH